MSRIIFHLDLNCFFCRCEEIINPMLEKLPFVVGYVSRRSIVCASNLVARTYNVKSAMTIKDAMILCPNLITVDVHGSFYTQKSDEFFACIRKNFNPEIEIMSIDECYMDATDILINYHDNYTILAQTMINTIFKETGLYVTIGIGDNKFLAKMAGDTKPVSKIACIFKSDVRSKIWPLAIGKLFMVGKKTESKLTELGIKTVEDFYHYPNQAELKEVLKPKGYEMLVNFSLGEGSEQIVYWEEDHKTISSGHTFDINTNDDVEITRTIKWLAGDLTAQLNEKNLLALSISVRIKFDYTEGFSKILNLENVSYQNEQLYGSFLNFFKSLWNEEELRSITLAITHMVRAEDLNEQLKLDDTNY